jgi:dTDP-4-amino-4,6-dideoxygalactose transaminase
MPHSKIDFIKPKFPQPEELAEDLRRIYGNNYYSNNGPIYFEFKEKIESYLGQGIHSVIVSNATLGLMLAIQTSFGDKKKKYVAIPSFTFAAGPLAIQWCGFEPVFFDIDETTAQPSIDSFKEVLNKYGDQLAGVFLINVFGIGMENIDEWEALLARNNLPSIIDSAPGFGSTYSDGSLLGAKGSCEIFSFHATKPFGIGEGGLITTKDKELADRLEALKNFGFDSEKKTTDLGINAKITELDCAIGLRILKKYDDTLKDRRNTYTNFADNFKGHDIGLLPRAETAAIQFATIKVDEGKRPKILSNLAKNGVEARTYYAPAVHTFPFFAGAKQVAMPQTEKLSKEVISLPVHPDMPAQTVQYISDIVIESLS